MNNDFHTEHDDEVYLVDTRGVILNKKAISKSKLVHGVGLNDWKFAIGSTKGGAAPAYTVWTGMLERGYNEKFKARRPTYTGVRVSESWLSFSTFFNDTKVYMKKGWELDKDLLFFGNKTYSKNACIFVPSWLNLLLTDHNSARGEFQQGVSWYKRDCKFTAKCNVDGKLRHLGYFDKVEGASSAYIDFKLKYIETKRVAIEEVAAHNDLHLRFGDNFNLTDRVIENFKKQAFLD